MWSRNSRDMMSLRWAEASQQLLKWVAWYKNLFFQSSWCINFSHATLHLTHRHFTKMADSWNFFKVYLLYKARRIPSASCLCGLISRVSSTLEHNNVLWNDRCSRVWQSKLYYSIRELTDQKIYKDILLPLAGESKHHLMFCLLE